MDAKGKPLAELTLSELEEVQMNLRDVYAEALSAACSSSQRGLDEFNANNVEIQKAHRAWKDATEELFRRVKEKG